MVTYRVGRSRTYKWGVETDIILEENNNILEIITVMNWPENEKEQIARGNHLIANHESQIKPEPPIDRDYVEHLLVEKGLLAEGQKLEEVKSMTELSAEVLTLEARK
jgi:hypothetical protein